MIFLAGIALAGALPRDTAACINASPTSTNETAIASQLACNWDFVLWADRAYGAYGGDNWNDNGRKDACNTTRAFAKWIDSAALLTHDLSTATRNGITRSFFGDGGLQWHGLDDYAECAQSPGNAFHDGVYYSVMDDVTPPGSASITWARANRTKTWSLFAGTTTYEWTDLFCQSFDNAIGAAGSEPGWRAAMALHESWHHWQIKNGYEISHPGGCPAGGGASCDYFYFHKIRDFDFGALPSYSTGTPLLFHSPNQVAMEYLCDLAEEGTDWVTPQIATLSKLQANFLISTIFVNPVPWTCGTNRIPLYP
jgi:hypothetical protein